MSFTKDKAGLIKTVGGISLFDGIRSNATATPDMDGLMSAADKEKLDGLHNYVHPDSGVIPGKYLVVEVDERGHVIAGQGMKYSTLADFGIADAYINLEDNSVVLGSHRVKVITPDDKVRWDQLVDVPQNHMETWHEGISYKINDVIIYGSALYCCVEEHISSIDFADDKGKWQVLDVPPYVPEWEADCQYKQNEVVVYQGNLYQALTAHTSSKTIDEDITKWCKLSGNGVQAWTPTTIYFAGQMVSYGDTIYVALVRHTSGQAFEADLSKWQILCAGVAAWKINVYYPVGTTIVWDSKLYQCTNPHTSTAFVDDKNNWQLIGNSKIDDWQAGHRYFIGDICLYRQKLYRCKTNHTSGSTLDIAELEKNWNNISGDSSGISEWIAGENYRVGQVVKHQYLLYEALDSHQSGESFDDDKKTHWQFMGTGEGSSSVVINKTAVLDWQTAIEYTAGQLVTFDGILYKSKINHTSGGSFTDDRVDKWEMLSTNVGDWQADKLYFTGMIVIYDKALYQSLADVQSSVTPNNDTNNWQCLISSKTEESDIDFTSYVQDVIKKDNNLTIIKGNGTESVIPLPNITIDKTPCVKDISKEKNTLVVTKTDNTKTSIFLNSETTSIIKNGARIIVNVPTGTTVTCTNEEDVEVGTMIAENNTAVFDVGYGKYKLTATLGESSDIDEDTVEVRELRMYYITLLFDTNSPAGTGYRLYVITEYGTDVTMTNGTSKQTKTVQGDYNFVSFVILDRTKDVNVSITKSGATIEKTVTFAIDEYVKYLEMPFAKIAARGIANQNIRITMDSYSFSKVLTSDDEQFIVYVPALGKWSITSVYYNDLQGQGVTYNKVIDVTEYKIYEVSCWNRVYAFSINNDSNPATKVKYLGDCTDYTPAKMNFQTGKFDWGSWKKDEFFMPRPCMLKSDGTVDYYLNEQHYDLKADSMEPSDINNPDYDGNAMMEWGRYGKKIWCKIVPNSTTDNNTDTTATIYIADEKLDDDYHAWSFINNYGELVDHFYTPIYNGAVVNNKMRSLSGFEPQTNTTVSQEIQYAEANNPRGKRYWYTEVYSDITLINLLLIMLGKSTNTQAVFGTGNSSGSNKGLTGQLDSKGLFYGYEKSNVVGVKVFGMENWWGNVRRRYAGHVADTSTYKHRVKLTYGNQDGGGTGGYNAGGSGYLMTDYITANGFISGQKYSNKYGMFGCNLNNVSSSYVTATTYYCDYCNSGKGYAVRGGAADRGDSDTGWNGAFSVWLNYEASIADRWIGSALSCKPEKKK